MGSNTIYNFFYPDTAGYYQKVRSMDANNVKCFQQQTGTCGYSQSFGGFCPNYSFQQMEHYPDPYGQHNSLLQYQPPSCGGHPLSLPLSSFDSYRCPEYPNLLGPYPRDYQFGIGQAQPSGFERGLLSQGTNIYFGSQVPKSVSSIGPIYIQREPLVHELLFPEKERDNPGLSRERNAPFVAE
jgi:hypothetical protein